MRAKFKTAKSIYKPLEIEIDDKVYVCKKITKDFLEKFLSYEQAAIEGDLDSPYQQANFAFGIPVKILHKLDAPEVRDINAMVLNAITDAEKVEAQTEKGPNSESPGDSS